MFKFKPISDFLRRVRSATEQIEMHLSSVNRTLQPDIKTLASLLSVENQLLHFLGRRAIQSLQVKLLVILVDETTVMHLATSIPEHHRTKRVLPNDRVKQAFVFIFFP